MGRSSLSERDSLPPSACRTGQAGLRRCGRHGQDGARRAPWRNVRLAGRAATRCGGSGDGSHRRVCRHSGRLTASGSGPGARSAGGGRRCAVPSDTRGGRSEAPALRLRESELTWRFSPPGGPAAQPPIPADTRVPLSLALAATEALNAEERERALTRLSGRLSGTVLTVTVEE